jgi:hypothetical protein
LEQLADPFSPAVDVNEIKTVKRLHHSPVTDRGPMVGIVNVRDLLVFAMR